MILEHYTDLKAQIIKYLPELKGNVFRFNNQFNHSNGKGDSGRDESSFQYPVVFLEYNDFEFRQLSMGVQEFDFSLTTHFGFKSFLKEDDSQLVLSERLYWVIQRFQQGNSSRLARKSSIWDTNHNDIIIETTKYGGYSRDWNRYVLATATQSTIDYIGITASIVTGFTQSLPNGYTDLNGANTYPDN